MSTPYGFKLKTKIATLGACALLAVLAACDAIGPKKIGENDTLRLETPILARGNQLGDGIKAHDAESYQDVLAFYASHGVTPHMVLKGKPFSANGLIVQVPKDFASLENVDQKKQAFLSFALLPVRAVNASLMEERASLLALQKKYAGKSKYPQDVQEKLQQSADRFGGNATFEDQLKRVDMVPTSLALAQAAIESGWGTSRFAIEGNALFGEHTTSKELGLNATGDKAVHVEAFDTVYDSVASYMFNLNSHAAYKDFRNLRASLREKGEAITGQKLAPSLIAYSERKGAYVNEIRSVIAHNDLALLDMNQG